jgi:hypothetical protein
MSKDRQRGNKEAKKPKKGHSPAKPGSPADVMPAVAPMASDRRKSR